MSDNIIQLNEDLIKHDLKNLDISDRMIEAAVLELGAWEKAEKINAILIQSTLH